MKERHDVSRYRGPRWARAAFLMMFSVALAACSSDDDDAVGSDPGTPPTQPGNGGPDDPGSPPGNADPGIDFNGTFVSLWNADAVAKISPDTDSTLPIMLPDEDLFAPGLFTWDGWPIRNLDGSIASFDGWYVYIALSSERPQNPGEFDLPFFARSTWRYWMTRDGEWQPGGLVFPEGTALGERQWAGSTYYDAASGKVNFYYTAVGIVPGGTEQAYPAELPPGNPAAGRPPVIQQMVEVASDVTTDASGVTFANFSEHKVNLAADGEIYQTFAEAITDNVIYGMRDPEYFRDPATGREYILFTANAAFRPGSHNGVVGVAERKNGQWELLPPLIASIDTSSQLERPHVVVRDGRYYIFFSTHSFTFSPPDAGPEGLYGFVSTTGDFLGRYEPLNGSGLVAGNPPSKPVQTYSYLVLPSGHVMSYLNQAGNVDRPAGWVGSPGPLLRVELQGASTRIVEADSRSPNFAGAGRPNVGNTRVLASPQGNPLTRP